MKPLAPRHRPYQTVKAFRHRGNPYFNSRRKDSLSGSKIKNILAFVPTRAWFWIIATIIVLGVLFWLIYISAIFSIKKVEVRNASLASASQIESEAYLRFDHHRAFFFSESRMAVFNSTEFAEGLITKHALQNVVIKKRLPSTLIIELSERLPSVIWFEADQYYLLDSSGVVIASLMQPDAGLPSIYNNGLPRVNNQQVENASALISFASKLMDGFTSRFPNIKLKQLTVDNDPNTLKMITEKGPMIYFNSSLAPEAQFDRLDIYLHSELKENFAKLSYIDLRFGDKVYYK